MNNKGFALIAVIIVIVLLGIIALGIAVYVSESLGLSTSNSNQEKALYMAQAGIMRAIVDYSDDGLLGTAENVNVTGEFYYHVGGSNTFFHIDASDPKIVGNGRRLRNITITNTNSATDVAIDSLTVTWDSDDGETLEKISFVTGNYEWTGSASSGQNITIPYTFTSGTSYVLDFDWAPGEDVSDKTIVVEFFFSDGSSGTTVLLSNGEVGNNEFSVTATGEIRNGDAVVARRTLVVTYDVGTSKITSWEESQNHIIP